MIIVTIYLESGCSFEEREYSLNFDAAVQDSLEMYRDYDNIKECIEEYDGEIKTEIPYTFFLHRANIATASPGYEPAFAIHEVIPNLHKVNIQL